MNTKNGEKYYNLETLNTIGSQLDTLLTAHEEAAKEVFGMNKPKKEVDTPLAFPRQYGKSILEYVPKEEEDKNTVFVEDIMNENEIEEARKELKSRPDSSRTIDKVSIDTITGARASSKVTGFEISKQLNGPIAFEGPVNVDDIDVEIDGYGINLLTQLLGSEPTKEELDSITDYLADVESQDQYNGDVINNDKISNIEKAFGERIASKIKEAIDTSINSYENVFRKFVIELSHSYHNSVKLNDDIEELYELTQTVENMDTDVSDEEIENGTFMDKINILNNAMDRINQLDDRNKRLKNEYSLDDLDIHIIGSVRDCLDTALSFSKLREKISNNGEKYLKDMKDMDSVYKVIEKWINVIRSDRYTLFTFPVNDDLSLEDSRKGFLDYLFHAIIFNKIDLSELPVDSNENLVEYIVNNEMMTKKDVYKYYAIAIFIAYALCKTFKYKKIVTNEDRRVLSYTLDIISKLNITEYADIFMKVVDEVDDKFGDKLHKRKELKCQLEKLLI